MEVVLDENPEAQSRFQVALPDSQLSAPGTGPQWVLSGRMNERTDGTPLWIKLTHALTDWYQNTKLKRKKRPVLF